MMHCIRVGCWSWLHWCKIPRNSTGVVPNFYQCNWDQNPALNGLHRNQRKKRPAPRVFHLLGVSTVLHSTGLHDSSSGAFCWYLNCLTTQEKREKRRERDSLASLFHFNTWSQILPLFTCTQSYCTDVSEGWFWSYAGLEIDTLQSAYSPDSCFLPAAICSERFPQGKGLQVPIHRQTNQGRTLHSLPNPGTCGMLHSPLNCSHLHGGMWPEFNSTRHYNTTWNLGQEVEQNIAAANGNCQGNLEETERVNHPNWILLRRLVLQQKMPPQEL